MSEITKVINEGVPVKPYKMYGLSSIVKPINVPAGCEFVEEDTSDVYEFSGRIWIKKKTDDFSFYNDVRHKNGIYEISQKAQSGFNVVGFIAPANVQDNGKVAFINPNKTITNIHGKRLFNGEFYTENGNVARVSNDGYIELPTQPNESATQLRSKAKAINILKPNTVYTMIVDVVDKPVSSWLRVSKLGVAPAFTTEEIIKTLGISKVKLTTRNDLSNADLFLFHHASTNGGVEHMCKFKAWLLEGDYANKDVKITAKSEIVLATDYIEKPILKYGTGNTPIKQGQISIGEPIFLKTTDTVCYF